MPSEEISQLIMNHPEFINIKDELDRAEDQIRTLQMNLESVHRELSHGKKKEMLMLKEVMDIQNENAQLQQKVLKFDDYA
jgi:uncharacterized protein YdcH (DUF465 family)